MKEFETVFDSARRHGFSSDRPAKRACTDVAVKVLKTEGEANPGAVPRAKLETVAVSPIDTLPQLSVKSFLPGTREKVVEIQFRGDGCFLANVSQSASWTAAVGLKVGMWCKGKWKHT